MAISVSRDTDGAVSVVDDLGGGQIRAWSILPENLWHHFETGKAFAGELSKLPAAARNAVNAQVAEDRARRGG